MNQLKKNIENNYELEKLVWRGLRVWPVLKYHLNYQLISLSQDVKNFKWTRIIFGNMAKSIFSFLRSNNRTWLFTAAHRTVLIEGKRVSRISHELIKQEQETLVFESNYYGERTVYQKGNYFNEGILKALQGTLMLFMHDPVKVENHEILDKLLADLSFDYNYQKRLRSVRAQYFVMRLVLMCRKPQKVFLECYYDYPGYILAFKKKNIPVIEFQHGVISDIHPAYAFSRYMDTDFFPNYLLCFGEYEKGMLSNANNYIHRNNIVPVGNYLLCYLLDSQKRKTRPKHDKKVILISGQEPVEDKIIEFLRLFIETFGIDGFELVYKPRYFKETLKSSLEGVASVVEVKDFYQCLDECDMHMAVYSTTAIESVILNKKTILLNIDDRCNQYLSHLFDHPLVNVANDIFELHDVLCNGSKENISENNFEDFLIKNNHQRNISEFINNIKYE